MEFVVFYGPSNSLETKPSISVVFASFWKWRENTFGFEFLIFDGCFETYVGLKFVYVWFGVDLGLV